MGCFLAGVGCFLVLVFTKTFGCLYVVSFVILLAFLEIDYIYNNVYNGLKRERMRLAKTFLLYYDCKIIVFIIK